MDAWPDRIELRTQMRQVTFDFTSAVITSRILRIDTDMKLGKLAIGSAPGIVIDADGLNLRFSRAKLFPDSATAASRLPIEIVATLNDAKAVERRP